MNNLHDTAILLFSRSADQEGQYKRWTREPELNYQIAKHLIWRTSRQLAQSALPVFHIDEMRQRGSSFGEKLTNAFQDIFDAGYQFVICAGNDCQNLQLNWNEIANKLKSGKTVLGPDQAGGVYLIGISAKTHFRKIFQRISWNTSNVFDELSELCAERFILETRRDTNTFEDIRTDKELYAIFKKLRAQRVFKTGNSNFTSPHLFIRHKPLRAPPFSS